MDDKNETTKNRRSFLKKSAGIGALTAIGGSFTSLNSFGTEEGHSIITGKRIKINPSPKTMTFKPLDLITVSGIPESTLTVLDGQGRKYVEEKTEGTFTFTAGGTLGNHIIFLLDNKKRLLDVASFKIDCQTEINDENGIYKSLLNTLYWTMTAWSEGFNQVWVNNKFYSFFVCWLRDHVHTMKGMKYFAPDLKTGIDLYADYQREDGMIWDNIHRSSKEKNWWEKRFSYGGFYKKIEDGKYEFRRIPVENDVEYLFIEGIYYTWKATGDTVWMSGLLDKALKAIEYSTKDIYRWSEKYKLLKRGYTIDTWDFQTTEDAAISGNDIMVVYPDKTRFGIMFGDNTGMIASCTYLAEMLNYTGRVDEAKNMEELGKSLKQRIDKLAWNGKFYTHHIPEDPSIIRDLGVDEKSQVSLSNAYSLNRGLDHDQCVAIIKTYQTIREQMPASSPGEWYTIYPPFEKGFGKYDSSGKWEYMNAGVTSIVAGELAHGAFENGFEEYGADILKRIGKLAEKTDNYLHCAYRGAMPDIPQRNFNTLSLKNIANIEYPPRKAKRDQNAFGYGAKDSILTFHGIPFEVPDTENNRQTGIGLSLIDGKTPEVSIKVDQKAASIYFLHSRENGQIAGTATLKYEDGSEFIDYITSDKVGFWWSEKDPDNCKLAWRSNNEGYYIGLFVYGMNNPYPEKTILSIDLKGHKTVPYWYIAAVTLCNSPVFFMPSIVSHGIPDNWGAGAVVYALVEGLAGVRDTGVAYSKASIAPRWEAARINKADVTIKYEASGGYVSYSYENDQNNKQLNLTFTSSGEKTQVELLLPDNKELNSVLLNGEPVQYSTKKIQESRYITFEISGNGVYDVKIKYN